MNEPINNRPLISDSKSWPSQEEMLMRRHFTIVAQSKIDAVGNQCSISVPSGCMFSHSLSSAFLADRAAC